MAPVMVDSSGSSQLVSVAEAARILNVSDSTVRRLVKRGRLEAEQAARPQGHVWLVRVPAPASQTAEQPSWQLGAAAANPSAPVMPPALTAWMASVLEPVLAELAVGRAQLIGQSEQIGTLKAELAAEKAAHAPGAADLTRYLPGAALIAILAAAIVLLLR